MAPRTRKAKKNSSSKESGDVPRQEKRRDEDKSIVDSAKKSTAVTRPRKRRCDESKSIVDSPKKICYDKASTSMEKRDKIYCSTIAKSKLKSLRMSPDDDDDSDDFAGFKKDDADDISYWAKRKIAMLEFAQDFLNDELTSENQSENINIPEIAPVCKDQNVDDSQDITSPFTFSLLNSQQC